MYLKFAINIFTLCAFIITVQSKCERTHTNECEKVSDVELYGRRSWASLILSPDRCKSTTASLDETLVRDMFIKTPNIEELIIVEKITKIESGALNGIKRLTLLKFYKNQLTVIPRNAFANLRIYKLDLKRNSIENIEHDLLKESTVTVINIAHNKLTNLQVNMLNIPTLEKLTISNNNLQFLAEGCFHNNLEFLNLASNSLSQIAEGVLRPLTNLKDLNLSNNRFKSISLSYALPSLENLDLSRNQIGMIAEGSFRNFFELKRLKLNHNYLTSISPHIFPVRNSITTLHLHYNAFMFISDSTGNVLTKLEEITIGGNPWACPCLVLVTSYIQEHNISQPECDQEYFSTGKSAVCVITGGLCTFEEQLKQEDFNHFRNSLHSDTCNMF